jgi:heme-degrading monooxygenase HmoA
MTRVQTSPDHVEEAARIWEQQVMPAARQQAGFSGAALLADRTSGTGISVTYWANEAALRASDANADARRGEIAQATGGEVLEVDRFELVVSERNAPPKANAFVRINDVQGSPAKIDEGVRFVRDKVMPAVKQLKGYRAIIMGVNRESGRAYVTTVWESAADREASESALAEQRRQGGQTLGAEQVKVENYEALFVEMNVPVTVGAA